MDMTQQQVDKLSRLARLSLTREEGEELTGRLAQMVGYMQQLTGVQQAEGEKASALGGSRPDGVEPSPVGDRLLENAPQVRDGYVVTPRSVGDEGQA